MKITWKLFFSTVITMIVTFCLAGYFLISALFQSGYEQAVDGAINVDQLFLHEFGNYMVGVSKEEDADRHIGALADELLMENIQVHIQKEDGSILYSNTYFPENKIEVRAEAEGMTRRLVNYEGNYYIQVKSRVTVEDMVYQAVLFHDVSDLFIKREEEIQIYQRFLILFLLLDGLVSLILAGCIVRPIKKISRSAGRIAGGDLEHRIRIRGGDEISRLGADFNRMADSLAGKIQELEDAAERQEEFIGSFAHELKTPLTSIIGYADLLRSNRQTEEQQFLCANYIFKEGKRLETLSFRLLDLIVLEKSELRLCKINALDFLQEIQGMLMPIMESKGKKLVVSAEEGTLWGEPELLHSVFINLADNAAKSTATVIVLNGKAMENEYEIEVCDNGQGIPEEELVRITEAFYMVDKSRSRRQGGAGLGLAICQKILDLHEATMNFESRQGEGTWVKIRFPANVGDSEDTLEAEEERG